MSHRKECYPEHASPFNNLYRESTDIGTLIIPGSKTQVRLIDREMQKAELVVTPRSPDASLWAHVLPKGGEGGQEKRVMM